MYELKSSINVQYVNLPRFHCYKVTVESEALFKKGHLDLFGKLCAGIILSMKLREIALRDRSSETWEGLLFLFLSDFLLGTNVGPLRITFVLSTSNGVSDLKTSQ